MPMTPEDPFMPLSAAGTLVGLSPSSLRQMIKDRRLKAVRTSGGHFRVTRTELLKALEPTGA